MIEAYRELVSSKPRLLPPLPSEFHKKKRRKLSTSLPKRCYLRYLRGVQEQLFTYLLVSHRLRLNNLQKCIYKHNSQRVAQSVERRLRWQKSVWHLWENTWRSWWNWMWSIFLVRLWRSSSLLTMMIFFLWRAQSKGLFFSINVIVKFLNVYNMLLVFLP